jgi:hypothetical protein
MNERIKQLADQVWKEILDETSIDGDISTTFSPDEVVAFEQKFAELIIEEMYCFMVDATSNNEPWPSFDRIKQHFGVKQ